MYQGYSWSCPDVLSLLNVRYDDRKEEVIIPCPFCDGKRFGMNMKKGTGYCFNCHKGADSAGYYAAAMGLSLNDARNDIKRRLNIPDEHGKLPERKVFKEVKQSNLVDAATRDKVYRAFLNELILTQKNYDHLLARGFSSDDIAAKGYKTYPSAEHVSFEGICRKIMEKGLSLEGVPGFYKYNGEWTFPRYTQGIIIPQVNIHNQIESFQIRKDDDLRRVFDDGEIEEKCVFFSSKGKYHGAGAHTSVHIATDFIFDKETNGYIPVLHGNKVTLTEGGMKADLCSCLLDGKASVISIPGVNAHGTLPETLESLKKYGLKTVNLAFDMDYLTNKNVQNAMNKVKEIITNAGLEYQNIMNWDFKKVDAAGNPFTLKGLDDFLAYEYKKVIPVTAKTTP